MIINGTVEGSITPPLPSATSARSLMGEFVRFARQTDCTGYASGFVQTNSFNVEMNPEWVRNPRTQWKHHQGSRPTHTRVQSKGSLEGDLSYTDILLLFSSIVCIPSIGSIAGSIKDATYFPNSTTKNEYAKYTIERGCVLGSRASCCVLNDLTLKFSSAGCKVTGEFAGGLFEDTSTLSPIFNETENRAVNPSDVSVYLGYDISSLVKLQNVKDFELKFTDRYTPQMGLNPTYQSVYGFIQKSGIISGTLSITHNIASYGLMNSLANENLIYMRVLMEGAELTGGIHERIEITFPCYLTGSSRGDLEDEFVNTYNYEVVHSDDFAGYFRAVVRTNISAELLGIIA